MAHDDDGPETITLWVEVPVAVHAAAERVAKRYAADGLEGVLAAFACDVSKAEDRPGPWSQNLAAVWLFTRPWPGEGEKEGA